MFLVNFATSLLIRHVFYIVHLQQEICNFVTISSFTFPKSVAENLNWGKRKVLFANCL